MHDIFMEMERLQNICQGGVNPDIETTLHTYFAPLGAGGELQMPYEAVCRTGFHIGEMLIMRLIYDREQNEYMIYAEKMAQYYVIAAFGHFSKAVSVYRTLLGKSYTVKISKKSLAALDVNEGDTVVITVIKGDFYLRKYQPPYAYYIK